MPEPGNADGKWGQNAPERMKSDAQLESVPSRALDSGRSSPIDFSHLRRYTLGNARLEREVLELFCSHAPVLLAELRAAGTEKSWREAAHSLKGSALAIGAWEVARGAEQAELAAAPQSEWGEIVTRLEAAVARVQRFTSTRQMHA